MKKIEKFGGFRSKKYGLLFTDEQKRINQLIDAVNTLNKKVKELENRATHGIEQ